MPFNRNRYDTDRSEGTVSISTRNYVATKVLINGDAGTQETSLLPIRRRNSISKTYPGAARADDATTERMAKNTVNCMAITENSCKHINKWRRVQCIVTLTALGWYRMKWDYWRIRHCRLTRMKWSRRDWYWRSLDLLWSALKSLYSGQLKPRFRELVYASDQTRASALLSAIDGFDGGV